MTLEVIILVVILAIVFIIMASVYRCTDDTIKMVDKEEFTPEQMKKFEAACCGDNPPKGR